MIETTLNPIDAVKKAAVDFINSHDFFKSIPCIWDEKGDVDTQIEVKMLSIGMGIVLECNQGKVVNQAVGSQDVRMTPTITITENVLINRDPANASSSGKRAADIVCELFAIFNPATSQTPLPIYLDEFEVVNNTGSVITYQITGRANAGWKIKT